VNLTSGKNPSDSSSHQTLVEISCLKIQHLGEKPDNSKRVPKLESYQLVVVVETLDKPILYK